MTRLLLILLTLPCLCYSQTHPYKDLTHPSDVFGITKTYRIYLPESYNSSVTRYPVIYFFHGWGGRYYKDDSAKLAYKKLGEVVNKYQVILIMWDGNMEESEPRPYNIGNHEDVKYHVQMADYFPEFMNYIDSSYRTIADRDHRGIIGFSMGGFMASLLAGKYPDKISAAVNLVGSPEFFVGHPDNHTLYPIRYTLDNLKDVSFLLRNMDNCPLFYMNTEVKNAAEQESLSHFEYQLGKGDHMIDEPGETKVFENAMQFICNRFDNPVKHNRTWSHYDIYPEFNVWGYSIKSDKAEPGFLYLHNVSPASFGIYTHKWLPDGPFINCTTTVVTPPLYKRGGKYEITLYKQTTGEPVLKQIKADQNGCLHIEVPGEGYQVCIADKSQTSDFVVLQYQFNNDNKFIRVNKENEINLTLLNRTISKSASGKIQLKVSCTDSAVILSNAFQELEPEACGKIYKVAPIRIQCNKTPPVDASPPGIKLNVEVNHNNIISQDASMVPVFYDVPCFSHIKIDDGVSIRDKALGTGNGNSTAEPSEQIMLYENYQRLRLYTDDPYVEMNQEILYDEMISSGIWPDGYTLSSVVKIADNCPRGHIIEFLASYETKTFMPVKREAIWGKVKVEVK